MDISAIANATEVVPAPAPDPDPDPIPAPLYNLTTPSISPPPLVPLSFTYHPHLQSHPHAHPQKTISPPPLVPLHAQPTTTKISLPPLVPIASPPHSPTTTISLPPLVPFVPRVPPSSMTMTSPPPLVPLVPHVPSVSHHSLKTAPIADTALFKVPTIISPTPVPSSTNAVSSLLFYNIYRHSVKHVSKDGYFIKLTANITTKTEVNDWVKKFAETSRTQWRVRTVANLPNLSFRYEYFRFLPFDIFLFGCIF